MAYNIFEEYETEELLAKNFKRRDMKLRYPEDWDYQRGAYLRRNYVHEVEENLVVQEVYDYEYKKETDSLEREISKSIRKVRWFDDKGNIGHEEVVKTITSKQALKRINRQVRINRIDSLEVSGENLADLAETTPIELRNTEPYKTQYEGLVSISNNIFTLLRHYGADITSYKESGDPILEMRIRNESNVGIKAILDFVPPLFPGEQADPKFPNGRSIGKAILYEMTGETDI